MKERHGEEAIIYALKPLEAGSKGLEVCQEVGISEQTLYNWKKKFGRASFALRKLRNCLRDGPATSGSGHQNFLKQKNYGT